MNWRVCTLALRFRQIFLVLSSFLILATVSVADEVLYLYDDAGRLVKVVKGTEAILYEYDAVGNLLSVNRGTNSQTPPVLQSIAPDLIFIGATTSVVITGQNLFTTKEITSDNPALTFKNLSATDTAVKADITIPSNAGAGSANITVTTLYGSASIAVTLSSSKISFDPGRLVLKPAGAGVITVSVVPSIGRALAIVLKNSDPSVVSSPQTVTIPLGGTTSFSVSALKEGSANVNSGTPNTVVFVTIDSSGPGAGEQVISKAGPVSVLIDLPPGNSSVASQPLSARFDLSPTTDAIATASVSVSVEAPPGNSSVASQPVSAKFDLPPTTNAIAMASVSARFDLPPTTNAIATASVSVLIDSPPGSSSVASPPVSARFDLSPTTNAIAMASVSAYIGPPGGNATVVSSCVSVKINP